MPAEFGSETKAPLLAHAPREKWGTLFFGWLLALGRHHIVLQQADLYS
jgi:hypothetical protein